MNYTRRQFLLIGAALALGPVACGRRGATRGGLSPILDDEPFEIGPPQRYRRPKVYDRFAFSHGVYLVTNHYDTLVALAAVCTCLDRPLGDSVQGDSPSDGGLAGSVQKSIQSQRAPSASRMREFPPGFHDDACRVVFDPIPRQFHCPCHGSRYTANGLERQNGPAQRALERCLIRLTGTRADPTPGLVVDPTHRYRHQTRGPNHWSNPNSLYQFK